MSSRKAFSRHTYPGLPPSVSKYEHLVRNIWKSRAYGISFDSQTSRNVATSTPERQLSPSARPIHHPPRTAMVRKRRSQQAPRRKRRQGVIDVGVARWDSLLVRTSRSLCEWLWSWQPCQPAWLHVQHGRVDPRGLCRPGPARPLACRDA